MSVKQDKQQDKGAGLFTPLGKDVGGALRKRRSGDGSDTDEVLADKTGAAMAQALGQAKSEDTAGASSKGAAKSAAELMSHYSDSPGKAAPSEERQRAARPYSIPKPAPVSSTNKRRQPSGDDASLENEKKDEKQPDSDPSKEQGYS